MVHAYIHKHFWKILFTTLFVITISLLVWFILDVRNLYQTGSLKPTRGFNRNYSSGHTRTPTQIQGWMTFSYVNHIFNLPQNYLKDSLSITDSHYPNIGISRYAKNQTLDINSFLIRIQESVTQYITNTTI